MIFVCPSLEPSISENTLSVASFVYMSSSYGSSWELVASNNYTVSTTNGNQASYDGVGNIVMSESGKYVLYSSYQFQYKNCDAYPEESFYQAKVYISSSYGLSWYSIIMNSVFPINIIITGQLPSQSTRLILTVSMRGILNILIPLTRL